MLWEGSSRPWSTRDRALNFRLTRDALHIGVPSDDRAHDIVPLSIVEGVEVGRSVFQRMRGIGQIKLSLDRRARPLQAVATLADIDDPDRVGALIREQVDRVRRQTVETRDQSAPSLPMIQELREIAALHDAGALTDDEFERLKARLIDP